MNIINSVFYIIAFCFFGEIFLLSHDGIFSLNESVKISQIIAALIVTLTFISYNIRAKFIEVEKTRIQCIINTYKSFSLFMTYLRQWISPLKFNTDIPNPDVIKKLYELNNDAIENLTLAELYIKPETFNKMYKILDVFRRINLRLGPYNHLKETAENCQKFQEYSLSQHYSDEASKEFKIIYEDLPKHIESLFNDINNDFYYELHGFINYLFYRINKFLLKRNK
jgi:hypothetical protein